MKKMVYLFLAILGILLEIYTMYQIKEVKGLIQEYLIFEVDYNLVDTDYYNRFLLDEYNYKEVIESKKDVVIYFRSDNCSHCLKCDEMIMSYLASGYDKYCPIYFAKYDMVPDLYDQYFFVDSTPTILLVNNKEIIDRASGFEEAFALLDNIVNNMVPEN